MRWPFGPPHLTLKPSKKTQKKLNKNKKNVSKPCPADNVCETNPHSILRTPFAGHCVGALWGGKPCPAELSEGVNRVFSNLVWRHSPADSPDTICWTLFIRNALSTAGNSMMSSERPSPEPLLKKEASPAVPGGGEDSGNALEASNILNYRVSGIPAILSRGIAGNALRAFPGSFRNSSRISSGKCQPYWGCGPV